MKTDHKGREQLVVEFNTWQEFIEYSRPFASRLYSCDVAWNGNIGYKVADEYADLGWLEGAAKARDFYAMHVDALSNLIEKQEMYYDVEGPVVDIGRVVTGEPECCMNFETVRVEQPATRFVRVVVNVGASGGINADTILARGAALCALVDLLESSGCRCEIAIADATAADRAWYCSTVTVKQFDQPLDLPLVAYAIGHPSVLRTHLFRMYERFANDFSSHWRTVGYGIPADVPTQQRGDLYAPKMRADESQWSDPARAQAWIIEQLKTFGVALKKSA